MSKKFDVKSVTVEKKTFDEAGLKKLTDLIKKYDVHQKPIDLLPRGIHEIIRFELHGTTANFANAVRRVLMDELECLTLACGIENIRCSDPYLVQNPHKIICEISSAIINQMIPEDEIKRINEGSLCLIAANKNSDDRKIKCSDLYFSPNANFDKKYVETPKVERATIDVSYSRICNFGLFQISDNLLQYIIAESFPQAKLDHLLIEPMQILSSIREETSIYISRIQIRKGTNSENGRYGLLDNVSYTPLDVDPANLAKTMEFKDQTNKFAISFETRGNITVARVIELCCNVFYDVLGKFKKSLEEFSESKKPSFKNEHIVITANQKYTEIISEKLSYSVLSAVTRAAFDIDPSIGFIAISRQNNAKIKINHPNFAGLLLKGVDETKKNIDVLSDAFAKFKTAKTRF